MATEVSSSLMRAIDGGDSPAGISTAPITRDFLGGVDGKELEGLDLQVPSGWEKRLDLKSGKIYLQRSSSSMPKSASDGQNYRDLWSTPKQGKQTLDLLDLDSGLELKLLPASPSPSPSYQSVCTLDKVKSALERAEKASAAARKRSVSSSSTSSSSVRDAAGADADREERSPEASFAAAACSGCLMYVLVSPGNPTCPRCGCRVPLPAAAAAAKRPRIDLNLSV
ncbi:protein CURLY FLAG LEAF 1-like [Andrographis paniculata]|uniref:protein CURLY FLAG LEAF 1-like n=1 Tax=Andrographis paniculata TaxID=175694 RepID=UPI0021E7559B|nr:protein CURLY FLAG LEAF 1-like [Andrographis paniculata]